jgi:FkbM family methyltransferase
VPDARIYPQPDLDVLTTMGVAASQRVLMTISCHDSDPIPKVDEAGAIVERDGRELQRMHNGLLVERGCYYGPWMDEIIRATGGHHEPQEELVFFHLLERLSQTEGDKCSVELGSFWAYYSMWFVHNFPGARSIALEPDPAYLEVGKRNAALNGLQDAITFGQGAVGAEPGSLVSFVAESDGEPYDVKQYDLASTMAEFDLSHVDLLMVDIQGFEEVLLPRALEQFAGGKVRFLIVSTHHHIISGNPTTHQDVLDLLVKAGAHIIVEHNVSESYSGDGLIAASFDPRDEDFTLDVSYNRASASLFGGLEAELADTQRQLAAARAELEASDAARQQAARDMTELRNTRVLRYSASARSAYAAIKSRLVRG